MLKNMPRVMRQRRNVQRARVPPEQRLFVAQLSMAGIGVEYKDGQVVGFQTRIDQDELFAMIFREYPGALESVSHGLWGQQ